MASETVKGKVDKLSELKEQLENLRIKDYRPPITPDQENARHTSREYEFEDAYSEPELAIALFIEISQIKHEIVNGQRVPIISSSRAKELRFPKQETNRRHGHIVQKTVIPKQAAIIEVRL